MSVSLMKDPITIKSPKIWNVPSQKSKYLILGNQHDNLECKKIAYIRIVPKNGHPIIFRAKIQIKKNGYNSNSVTKFIQIPQNLIPFMPEDIKVINVQIIKLEK